MGSKIFLLLGLLMAFVLLISSEVAAIRHLAETSIDHNQNSGETTETNGIEDDRGESGGGVVGGSPGRGPVVNCGRGKPYRNCIPDPRGGGGGGYCRYGCCGSSNRYNRGCSRCCSYAGEAVDAERVAKPHN